MRRYLVNQPIHEIPTDTFDVVIAGGGLSGLYTALRLNTRLRIALVLKSALGKCNSSLAQGGIAAAVGKDDHPEIHLRDTLRASAGTSDTKVAKMMVENAPSEINLLASMGVPFDTDKDGNWQTTCEGAHSVARIVHCGGDATGKLVMERLIALVHDRSNISVFEHHFITDIFTSVHHSVSGIVAWNNGFRIFKAPNLVLATGGIGGIYRFSTNKSFTTGDGIASAFRAGARLDNMEFVQFHPTAFFNPRINDSVFLISEAVRGEGAILRNHLGVPFMENRHRFKDLAPRDVVAREIFREMTESSQEHVFLDITCRSAQFLKKRFPTIYSHLRQQGFRMETDMIPVVPAQHYFMGGVKTDENGMTTIHGLYACGEVACTGVHGANRLASNSLLECIVFASQVAQSIHGSEKIQTEIDAEISYKTRKIHAPVHGLKSALREMMQTHGGIVRNPQGLLHAAGFMNNVLETTANAVLSHPDHFELHNMAVVAREVLLAALARRESIGSHYLREENEDPVEFLW